MTLTASALVVANRFIEILDAAKGSLGLADVWFGDQDLVPRTPTLCVEPGIKRRELSAAQNMTTNTIDTTLLLYHSVVTGSDQTARRDSVSFAEGIETFLHQNHLRLFASNGDQLTIHGHCAEMDPGYAYKQTTRYHAVLMTWTSITKTRLLA